MSQAGARYRRRNLAQTVALVIGMAAILALIGWVIAGGVGIAAAVLFGAVFVAIGMRASAMLLLRLYRARALSPAEAPRLYAIANEIAARAEVDPPPTLYYIPSAAPQAFTVDHRGRPLIALTDGILRGFDAREIAAVIAHEMAHVDHDDIKVMTLADVMTRMTRTLASTGLVMVIVSIPFYLADPASFPWAAAIVLIAAPTAAVLLQLALSRTREFEADRAAAELTGDPEALARSLARLESVQERLWRQVVFPGGRSREPSLLRTHPETRERIARLAAMPEGRKLAALAPPPVADPRLAAAPALRWWPFRYGRSG